MVELRVMICDKTGKTYKKVLPDQSDLIGKKIGDKISGDFLGRLVLGVEDEEIKVFGATIF